MRGSIFDDDERERQRPRSGSAPRHDTELTLGPGTLLGIFFVLVVLCGLCFGIGYSMGRRRPVPVAMTSPQPTPDQEPLQASGNIPKPSAITQVPAPAAGATTAAGQPAGTPTGTPGATATSGQTPAQLSGQVAPALAQSGAAPVLTSGSNLAAQVHPALTPGAAAQAYAAQQTRPAVAQQQLMVQIAAVSNAEDAEVLVNALRKRNYPVSAEREPGDNLIHVRIGPFATLAIANQWRMKLLNSGYNAVVLP